MKPELYRIVQKNETWFELQRSLPVFFDCNRVWGREGTFITLADAKAALEHLVTRASEGRVVYTQVVP